MDNGAHKLLESATHRTLHANSFSRSSAQASLVLTDLLSRYLALLSTTCAKYAQHAGRTGLSARDALSALDELGVSMEELSEYCASEGSEFGRYAIHSARRVEDLNEFKAQLADGLGQDRDDAIPLHYAPMTTLPDEYEEEEEDEDDAEGEVTWVEEGELATDSMDVDLPPARVVIPAGRKEDPPNPRPPSTPPLPLSPISNPSSPARKRPRTSNWRPPSHIPDFLPPFPSIGGSPSEPITPKSPHLQHMEPPPVRVESVKIEKPPSPPPQAQPLTSTSASDYLVQVPYSQSSLSSTPEWHLPSSAPIPPPPLQARLSRLPTPQTQPALIAAYHHILTHPPPPNTSSANPSRHKVAMALLSQTQTSPRWEPPDTLYSSIAPCQPRVAPVGPTHPIPIGTTPPTPVDSKSAKADDKDKDPKMPVTQPRPVSAIERLTPLISQQPSRIPDLARHVLPATILSRTSRLAHPPLLTRGAQRLTYGPGIPAPWNANSTSPTATIVATPIVGKPKESNGLTNGKGRESPPKPALPDARLYATWEAETKSFKVPLAAHTRNRGRMGSIQSSSGVTLSLGIGGRGRGGSKVG